MDTYQQEFIYNLKKHRQEKHLTQAELAELCHVSTSTLGNIECGISKPSFDLIIALARILEIHPALLFSCDPLQADNTREIRLRNLVLDFQTKLAAYFHAERSSDFGAEQGDNA